MSSTGHLPELESLRSQVADLARALAERDHSMQAHTQHLEQTLQGFREQSHLLRTIIEGTAAETGDEFFTSLVTRLTATLNVQYAIVGEVVGGQTKSIRTLAVSAGGTVVDNFEYALDQAPCGTGLAQPFWCFEQGVQARFPHFPNLATLGVDSHCGVSLRTKTGEVIGLLIVMDTKPLRNSAQLQSLMEVFASRATAELQRHRAEIAQRESESRLRFTQYAVDHAVDGVLWADESQRFVYANEAACRSLGYSQEELLRLSIPDIAPHHDPAHYQQQLDEIKQGRAATYESLHRRKEGTEFPVEISVTYLEHEGKGYTCGIVRDITDRKRVEQERLQALYDLQNIMETVPDIMFTLNTQGNLVKWNSRAAEVTGYTPEELLDKSALVFVPPNEQEQTAIAIQQAFMEGYAELDGHLLTKDLRTIPYHWTGATLKDPHGQIIGITGIGRDVSDKKRVEEELKRQRRHLVDAQAIAHLGSWEWDIDSGDAQWSDEQFRIFGHEPGAIAVTYDTFLASLHPDDHDRVLAAINAALVGKKPYDVECRIVRPNGDVRTIHSRGEVARDHSGHPITMSGTVLDITERKQTEDALRASEERWQLAVRGSNDGIRAWNIQTGEVFFSTRWKSMRGFEDHELTNSLDEWRSRIHPDDLERVLQRLDVYLAKQSPEFCEQYRVQQKDGAYMWILDRGAALWSEDGTPLRMAGSESDITERKQAEEALRESEERYRMLVDLSPNGIFVYCEGKTDYVNLAACRLLGAQSSEQILEQPTLYFVHPDYHAAIIESARTLLSSGEPVRRAERKYLTIDRTVIDVEVEAAPITWNGKPAIQGIFSDITERKRAEQTRAMTQVHLQYLVNKLREANYKLTALIWSSPTAIVMIDLEGNATLWNPAAERIFGWQEREVLGRPLPFIPPDRHEEHMKLRTAVLRDEPLTGLEIILQRKDGSLVQTELSTALLRDAANKPCGILGLLNNITDRKQAEEALRSSEERFRSVCDAMPQQVWTANPEGALDYVNQRVVEYFGQPPEQLEGWGWEQVVHPDDLLKCQTCWGQSLETGDPYEMEFRLRRASDETYRWHIARALPLRDHAGRIVKWYGSCTDISDRKHAEEALRQREQELRTVLDTLPVGVWFTDQTGKVLLANPAGRQIWQGIKQVGLGQDSDQIRWWEEVGPATEPHRWALARALTKGESTLHETLEIESQDGFRKTLRNSAMPVRDNDGRILGAIVLNEDITDRVRAEDALRQNHALLSAIMDTAIDIIFVKDRMGRYLHMNQAGARALGMTVNEVIGWNDYALWPSDLAASCQIADGRVLETGETVMVEETATFDGKTTVYLTIKSPYRDPEGRVIGVIGVSRDITERKQAEEALRTSEERFAKAFRSSPYPIVISELETGLFVDANEAAFQLFGYQPEDIAGHTSADLQLWPSPDHRRRFVNHLIEAGAIRNLEIDLRMRNGELRHCLVSTEMIELHGKRCMVTVGTDITEQKRAEEALRQSEARLTEAQRIAHIGSWELDLVSNRLTWSDEIYRIFEIDPSRFGASYEAFLALIHPQDRDLVNRAYQASVVNSTPYNIVHRLLMPDGRIKFVREQCETSYDEDGHPIRSLGSVQDITEQKQAEETLHHREQDLHHAMDERERISQDLHDGILQSLYAVGLGLETCKPLINQEQHQKALDVMGQAIGQLNQTMAEVRNFIAGLESEVLQGGDFETAVRTMINTVFQSHPVDCQIDIEHEALPYIPMERALQLLNILREAMSNIVRHAHASRISVSIRRFRQTIRIRIHDNGVGFDLKTATGTGHGLLNMAARAKKIRTEFELHSAPGKGTTIILNVPKEKSYAHG